MLLVQVQRLLRTFKNAFMHVSDNYFAPICFKISLLNDNHLIISDELSIYVMFSDRTALLHTVLEAAQLKSATLADSNGTRYEQSVEGIWFY